MAQFQTSPPFKIDWVRLADAKFYLFRELTNALHNDSKVFFGRDGQEIGEQSGFQVCEIIDEEARQAWRNDAVSGGFG